MTVNLEEYFRTTFEDKLLVKMPEREDDHLTPATRLLEKRREMSEVEQALAAQKEEFQMKMESLQQRREELERKEYQLKESLLKFDKFLKENDSKRARALKKAAEEKEMRRAKDREIARLKEETSTLTKERDRIQYKLEKNAIYQQYLEKVLESAEEEIRDVIARYDTLTATHEFRKKLCAASVRKKNTKANYQPQGDDKDLLERETKNQEKYEKEKGRLVKFTEEKNNEILNYNNQLAHLQTALERAQSVAVKWESQWTHIQNTAAKKTLLLGRIKMATHNLFMLVNRHLKQSTMIELTEKQLEKIQVFIQDLTQITNEIKRAETAATAPPNSVMS